MKYYFFLTIVINSLFGLDLFNHNRFITHSDIIGIHNKFELDNNIYLNIPDDDPYNVFQILSGITISDGKPINKIKLAISGSKSDFYYKVSTLFVNEKYKEILLGSNYSRFGFSGIIENSFISFKRENYSIIYGSSPLGWGESLNSSIILSQLMPNFEKINFSFTTNKFSFEIFAGQLESYNINNQQLSSKIRIKRFLSGKRFKYKVSPSFNISFGDLILYTGHNRNFESSYLNPFIPYFYYGLEHSETEENITRSGDNDNSLIFLHFRKYFSDKFSLYGEYILDDYQIDNTIRDNQTGIKIGISNSGILFNKSLSYLIDVTNIDRWTYLHNGDVTNFESNGFPIGYGYGPDSKNINFQLMLDLTNDSHLFFDVNYLKKGNNNFDSLWKNLKDVQQISHLKHVLFRISGIKKNEFLIFEFGVSSSLLPINIKQLTLKNSYDKNIFLELTFFTNKLFSFL